jgi:hypothetical protein
MQNEGAARQEERELPPLVLLPLLPRCRAERVERTLSPPWERRSSDSGFQSNPAARWHVKRAFCSAPGGIVRGCASSLASDAGIRDWWEGNLYLPLRRLVMRHQQTLGYSWFRGVRHHRMGTPQQWPHDPPREKVVNLTTFIYELMKVINLYKSANCSRLFTTMRVFQLVGLPRRMSMLPFGQNGVADSLCAPNDTVCVEVCSGTLSHFTTTASSRASSDLGAGAQQIRTVLGSRRSCPVFVRVRIFQLNGAASCWGTAAAARVQLHGILHHENREFLSHVAVQQQG